MTLQPRLTESVPEVVLCGVIGAIQADSFLAVIARIKFVDRHFIAYRYCPELLANL